MARVVTKHSIKEAARELFLNHGFQRTTVEDICHRAGVCRKTYYDYYGNKLDLVIETLDGIMSYNTGEYIAVMDSPVPFSEKLQRMLDMRIDFMKQGVQFMKGVLSDKVNAVKHTLEKGLRERRELVISRYRKAQKEGEIRSDICVEIIVEMHNKILDICSDDLFRAKFSDADTMIKQLSEMYLFGITKGSK